MPRSRRCPAIRRSARPIRCPASFAGERGSNPTPIRITIENHASERLLEYLGTKGKAGARTITPEFAYWMDLDVELTTGRVIANSFESGWVPDRTNPDQRERGAQRRVRRTGELAL